MTSRRGYRPSGPSASANIQVETAIAAVIGGCLGAILILVTSWLLISIVAFFGWNWFIQPNFDVSHLKWVQAMGVGAGGYLLWLLVKSAASH